MSRVFAVGVGPGSPDQITKSVEEIIKKSDIIIGYKYTLKTIEGLTSGKEIFEINMTNQEDIYQKIKKVLENKVLVIPFTGDVNFSESEVVDRLIEIFGDITIVPGISSIQIAASRAKIPLDKSRIITMHISTSIERQKIDLQKALLDGCNVVLIPRPWPKDPTKHFMPSEISTYLKKNGFQTDKIKVHVFEDLTNYNEKEFVGFVNELEGKEFSDLSVMVFVQTKLESYIKFN